MVAVGRWEEGKRSEVPVKILCKCGPSDAWETAPAGVFEDGER